MFLFTSARSIVIFVQYVSNETSWPSGLFYFFSCIFAEWRVPDLHSTLCTFIKIDFNSMFFHDIYYCTDVVHVSGVLQPSLQNVKDSRLQALIQVLPAVLKSKTVAAIKKYDRGFNSWRK